MPADIAPRGFAQMDADHRLGTRFDTEVVPEMRIADPDVLKLGNFSVKKGIKGFIVITNDDARFQGQVMQFYAFNDWESMVRFLVEHGKEIEDRGPS